MKRVLAMLPSVAVLLLLACGGGGSDGKLFIWEQMDPSEQELLDEHLARFMEMHPDIVVERVHYETEQLRTQFQNAALAGAGPELVYGPADQVGPFSTMGLIEPLDQHFSQAKLDSFYTDALPRLARRGDDTAKLWCLPDQLGNHLTLCFNKAMVPHAPQSFKHLVEMGKHWTKDEDGDGRPETYGLVFNQKEPFWLVPFLGGFGGWVVDEQGNPTLDSRAMASALSYVQFLKFDEGIMPREADYEVADALFKEGKAAFIINGPWSWQQYLDAGIDLGLTPIPTLFGGGWPVPMVSAKGYSLNANLRGEKREQALALLDYLTSEAVQVEKSAAMGMIPSRKSAAEKAEGSHPLVGPSRAQIEKGRAMPVIPEMRAIWDVMRPAYQEVLGNRLEPREAAVQMQEQVIKKIEEMGGN